MVNPVTVTHHVQITMVHTLANVIVVTPIPQLVSKLDLNVSLLLIAVLTMVVALMVALVVDQVVLVVALVIALVVDQVVDQLVGKDHTAAGMGRREGERRRLERSRRLSDR